MPFTTSMLRTFRLWRAVWIPLGFVVVVVPPVVDVVEPPPEVLVVEPPPVVDVVEPPPEVVVVVGGRDCCLKGSLLWNVDNASIATEAVSPVTSAGGEVSIDTTATVVAVVSMVPSPPELHPPTKRERASANRR